MTTAEAEKCRQYARFMKALMAERAENRDMKKHDEEVFALVRRNRERYLEETYGKPK